MAKIGSETEYTRSYAKLRGVDLTATGKEGVEGRMALMENLYRDYDGESPDAVESIPGYRRLLSLPDPIRALYLQPAAEGGDRLLIHSGSRLYSMSIADKDSGAVSELCDIDSEYSRGFSFGTEHFILTGKSILSTDRAGEAKWVTDTDRAPYVPTLYSGEEPYEERNLLSDLFYEKFYIENGWSYAYGSRGLIFAVTDEAAGECAVVGAEETVGNHVYIPSRTRLGGRLYRVKEIGDSAFEANEQLISVRIAEGVERIGKFAFYKAVSLKLAVLPRTVKLIDNAAFADCARLEELYLGGELERLGLSVVASCPSLNAIYYSGSEDELAEVENSSVLGSVTKNYGVRDDTMRLSLPISSDCDEILEVKIDGVSQSFKTVVKGNRTAEVLLDLEHYYDLNGKAVTVLGRLNPLYSGFGNSADRSSIEGKGAVRECRVCACHGDAVFYSGNPALPNTVFYSARRKDGTADPTYLPEHCYFNDGVGGYPVVALLSIRDTLAVFKAGDDGSGSIFYHTKKSTGDDLIPTVYPVECVHGGVGALGGAVSFLDDPVFLSHKGLCALTRVGTEGERCIALRSGAVNYDLLREAKDSLSLTEWQGYLVLGARGRIYLADSRSTHRGKSGDTEYDWYTLFGIGSHENSTRVYRYSSNSSYPYLTGEECDTVAEGEIISEERDGALQYFVIEDGKKYSVYPTEETRGGDFHHAIAYLGAGEDLFFGTEGGAVMVFNLDKRGVPPERISSDPEFDPEEYSRNMGRRIHPDFYSFEGHAVRYSVATPFDDCGIGHLTKSTVKGSLTVKCRACPGTVLHVEVGTDRSGYSESTRFPTGGLDFSELDFSSLSSDTREWRSLPVREREKGWVEKQITLFTEGFRTPLGLYSLLFRYTVKGRLKSF